MKNAIYNRGCCSNLRSWFEVDVLGVDACTGNACSLLTLPQRSQSILCGLVGDALMRSIAGHLDDCL